MTIQHPGMSHNRFSVMWNTNTDENKIDTLIIKTDDIVDVVLNM